MSDLFLDEALRGRLTDAQSAKRFLEAGNATLTLVSRATGQRFTYKFQRAEEKPGSDWRPVFVKLLSGSDNEADYTYMGLLRAGALSELVRTRKSRVGSNALSWKGVAWFLFHLYGAGGDHARLFSRMEVWHEGRCGRCGRKLTVPSSVASGFGPDCLGRMEP